MKIEEIEELVYNLKKRVGRIKTNYVTGDVTKGEIELIKVKEDGFCFIVTESFRKKGFFCAKNEETAIVDILSELPEDCVIQYTYRKENDLQDYLTKAGFSAYATYVRVTISYLETPFSIPEKGRRKLLQEMYDPNMVEYASIEDAEEIMQINKDTFDNVCDDVYTVEEWREIIKNRECVIVKEDGKIVSYYVWRIEGKKMYSNISVNKGSANLLYNLERYIFEQAWEQGIRVYYAWYNTKNVKALKRGNKSAEKVMKSVQRIYCDFWTKE